MAEIKSTLDLVMERTRHLTMSESDKRDQAAARFKTALNRLIRQYLDKDLDAGRFREQLSRLEHSGNFSDRGIVLDEIARRIDPDSDNRLLFDLLQSACRVNASGIRNLLEDCARTVVAEAGAVHDRLRKELREKGISGGAVVPNVESDAVWVEKRKEMIGKCRESLRAEIRRLEEE